MVLPCSQHPRARYRPRLSASDIIGPAYWYDINNNSGNFLLFRFYYLLVPVVVSQSGGAANSIPLGRNGFSKNGSAFSPESQVMYHSSSVHIEGMVGYGLGFSLRKLSGTTAVHDANQRDAAF